MKKYLPLILLGVGVLIAVVAVFLVIKKAKAPKDTEVEETVKEIPAEERPVVSLLPSADGHYLKLTIAQIKVKNAGSLDYELLYTLPDGRTQGVPGTVKLSGADIVKDLLLGSESSGKFRYDEGVDGGTVTIRFRDAKGKLIGRLSTKFTMQTGVTTLASFDGSFKYELDKKAAGVFFVTMQTFAEPNPSSVVVYQNGYGIFASDGKPHAGEVIQ